MSINSVKYHAGRVIEVLRNGGSESSTARLERLVSALDRPETRSGALERLISLCHVRALGDRHVENISLSDWWERLGKLDGACRRALREHDEEPPGKPPVGPHGPKGPSSGGGGKKQVLSWAVLPLAGALLFAIVMIAIRLPSFWPPETVEIGGTLDRTEVAIGSYSALRGHSGSLRALLFLDGDVIAYGIFDTSGDRWLEAAQNLSPGDTLTMSVNGDAWHRMRTQLMALVPDSDETYDIGQQAARAMIEAKRDPVEVVAIHTGNAVVYSAVSVTAAQWRTIAVWCGITIAIILALVAVGRRGRPSQAPTATPSAAEPANHP